MKHDKIEVDDIQRGEEHYSAELLVNIGFEIQDIMPSARDVLYEFVEEHIVLSARRLRELIEPKVGDQWERLLDLLLWYGFLGITRGEEATYIYDVRYDQARLRAQATKRNPENMRYTINPAFWRSLELKHGDRLQRSLPIEGA